MPVNTTKREVLVAMASGTLGVIGGTVAPLPVAFIQRKDKKKEQERILFGQINEKHIELRQHVDRYENLVRLWVYDLFQKTSGTPNEEPRMSDIRKMETFEDIQDHNLASSHILREYSNAANQAQNVFEDPARKKIGKIVRHVDRFVAMEKKTADFLIDLIEESPRPGSTNSPRYASKFFKAAIRPKIRDHLDIALRRMEGLIVEIRSDLMDRA